MNFEVAANATINNDEGDFLRLFSFVAEPYISEDLPENDQAEELMYAANTIASGPSRNCDSLKSIKYKSCRKIIGNKRLNERRKTGIHTPKLTEYTTDIESDKRVDKRRKCIIPDCKRRINTSCKQCRVALCFETSDYSLEPCCWELFHNADER